MSSDGLACLIDVSCLIGGVTILLPSVVYLITEWRSRRDHIFASLSEDALALYYKKFFPSLNLSNEPSIHAYFKRDFGRLYGRRHYVIPLILLAAVTGLGMWATAGTVKSWLSGVGGLKSLPPIAITAFLGAYAWALLDQFSRYQSRDFTKHDIYNSVYRFLIIIPLGYSVAAVVKADVGIALAFLLGTFPTQTLFKFGRRLVIDKMGLGEQETEGPTELAQLQGVGKANAERFQAEGLTTIVELAWFNPIDLTLRTNFEFNYIIDCISQALVWVYFGENTRKLYQVSLRGAQEAKYLWDTLQSGDAAKRTAAEKALRAIATLLGMDEESLKHTLDVIADDPYTNFLSDIWE